MSRRVERSHVVVSLPRRHPSIVVPAHTVATVVVLMVMRRLLMRLRRLLMRRLRRLLMRRLLFLLMVMAL